MKQPNDPAQFLDPARTKESEVEYRVLLEKYFKDSVGSNVEKLRNFPKFVPCQELRRFLARYEIFRSVINVHGSIVECGVLYGGGLMTWAALSELIEPWNHLRRVIGFDTFSGIPALAEQDRKATSVHARVGALDVGAFDDLKRAIEIFDRNRFLNHIPKVELVKGDAASTIPEYINDHPHLVIALLVLDFDLFEPTAVALKHFVPRMPKGAVIIFDQLNDHIWPGETLAVLETLGIRNLRIQRVPLGPTMSYAILE